MVSKTCAEMVSYCS